MIRCLFIYCCLILSLQLSAQIENTAEAAFDEIQNLYHAQQLTSAEVLALHFIKQYPKSNLAPRVHYNLGVIYFDMQQDEEAIAVFEDILNAGYEEQEAYGGIMEQYTLYSHRSARHLAELYLQNQEYTKANNYIHLFDKVYPYQHFCGNELSADRIYTARMYAKSYKGQGNHQKAITHLLPHVFYNGLASNQLLLEELESLLEEKYSQEELTRLTKKALLEIKVSNNEQSASVKFLNVKIKIDRAILWDIEDSNGLDTSTQWRRAFELHPVFKKYL